MSNYLDFSDFVAFALRAKASGLAASIVCTVEIRDDKREKRMLTTLNAALTSSEDDI